MKYGNEIRVGAVVLVGLIVITLGYFRLRGVGLGANLYYVQLNGAATVAKGNDVRLQGVKIGQVQDVDFDPQTQKPLLTIAVRGNPPLHLLKSYTYAISNAGIVGESYVDIQSRPGVPYDPNAPAYMPDGDISDRSNRIYCSTGGGIAAIAGNTNEVMQDFRKTLARLNTTLDRVNQGVLNYDNQIKLAKTLDGMAKLTNNASRAFGPEGVRFGFGDPQAQRDLNRTLTYAANASRNAEIASANIALASRDARGLTTNLRRDLDGVIRNIVSDNRKELHTLVVGLTKTSNNIAGITETLDFTLRNGGFKENTQLILASMRKAAENVEVATAGLRRLSEDQATQDDLKKTLGALRESSEALRDTANAIRDITTDQNTGNQLKSTMASLNASAKNLEGITSGLQSMVGDAELQGNLKGAAANLNATLAATASASERINGLLGGRRHRNAGVTNPPGTPGSTNTEPKPQHAGYAPGGFDFTYRNLFDKSGDPATGDDITGRNYGDLTFNSEFFGGPFRLGVSGIGESNDVTVQTGVFLGQGGAVRYGLYRSKLGAGVDLHKGRFSLEGNLYDPNDASYNAYAGFQITPQLQFFGGREGIRGTRANVLGVRVTP
jgi:ABC-type transporter Mla subunit MlaD